MSVCCRLCGRTREVEKWGGGYHQYRRDLFNIWSEKMKERTIKKVEMQHYHIFKPHDGQHKVFDSCCSRWTHRHSVADVCAFSPWFCTEETNSFSSELVWLNLSPGPCQQSWPYRHCWTWGSVGAVSCDFNPELAPHSKSVHTHSCMIALLCREAFTPHYYILVFT